MKRLIFTTAILAFGLSGTAQNLIPNPDFEAHGDCTNGPMWEGVDNWFAPFCSGPPLYLNACATTVFYWQDVPVNAYGSQLAHSGDGYVVLVTYAEPWGNIDKYITAALDTTLEQGVEYCLNLMVSLGDSSSFRTNTLHGIFSYDTLSACNNFDMAWPAAAQMTFSTAQVDTSSWTLLQGSFMAVGTERYVTIGNFLHDLDLEADTAFLGWNAQEHFAAFYIDDVYLMRCDVGIQELAGPTIEIYPNPASEFVYLELPSGMEMGLVRVVDMSGRLLIELDVNAPTEKLDVSDLVNGVYQILLLDRSGVFLSAASLVVSE